MREDASKNLKKVLELVGEKISKETDLAYLVDNDVLVLSNKINHESRLELKSVLMASNQFEKTFNLSGEVSNNEISINVIYDLEEDSIEFEDSLPMKKLSLLAHG